MSKLTPTVVEPPPGQDSWEAARRARLQREAAALRENLRRRKGQARARVLADQPTPEPPVQD